MRLKFLSEMEKKTDVYDQETSAQILSCLEKAFETLPKNLELGIIPHEDLRPNCAKILGEILTNHNFAIKICPLRDHNPLIQASSMES